MLWQIVIVLFLMWLFIMRLKRQKYYDLYKKLKNDMKCWPILGHAYLFLGNSENQMEGFIKLGREALRHKGVTGAWLGPRLFIIVADVEVSEIILRQCLEKDDVVKLSNYLIGNGSIFAPVSIWRPRRKVVAPTFSHKNLSEFVRIFAKQGGVMVQQLRSKVGVGSFSLWTFATTYTMDSVCETALGIQLEAQKNPNQPFLKALEAYTRLISARMVRPWLHSDFIYKLLPDFKELTEARNCMREFIQEIVQSKRREMREAKKNSENSNVNGKTKQDGFKCFLELMIDSSGGEQGFSDLELREEALVIVSAGTDTSAVSIAFTAIMLSWYPEVQEKVFEELKEVFGNSSRPVTSEDLPRLKYLDAVVRETLRLYPPVPVTARKVTSDVTLPTGVTFASGCGVVINIWAIHRNPMYWGDDAEVFRPERFLDIEYKHPAQFQAFSYGARNCLGFQYAMMSTKTVLATLLRHYRFLPAKLSSDGKPDRTPLRLTFTMMLKNVDGFMVQLEMRK